MIKQGITRMLIPALSRLLKTWFPVWAIDAATTASRGSKSGSELFLEEIMADERGIRHQLFVPRRCRS